MINDHVKTIKTWLQSNQLSLISVKPYFGSYLYTTPKEIKIKIDKY